MITSQSTETRYIANGETTEFPFPFKVLGKGDLRVSLEINSRTIPMTLGIDYTLAGLGNNAGGSVIFGIAPPQDTAVYIFRETELIQPLDLKPDKPLPADSLELVLDRMIAALQEMRTTADNYFGNRPGISLDTMLFVLRQAGLNIDGNRFQFRNEEGKWVTVSVDGETIVTEVTDDIPGETVPPNVGGDGPGSTSKSWVLAKIQETLMEKVYGVGKLWVSTDGRRPEEVLGFGSWTLLPGQFIVGTDPNDETLKDAGKLVGSMTRTLDISQLPPHKITIPERHITTDQGGWHSHNGISGLFSHETGSGSLGSHTVTNTGSTPEKTSQDSLITSEAGNHNHGVTIPECESEQIGGGQEINIMPRAYTMNIYLRIS